jgi:hypothetical protein
MLTCNRLEAGGSKLEAWLTVADFFKLRASSLLPQAYICLGRRPDACFSTLLIRDGVMVDGRPHRAIPQKPKLESLNSGQT